MRNYTGNGMYLFQLTHTISQYAWLKALFCFDVVLAVENMPPKKILKIHCIKSWIRSDYVEPTIKRTIFFYWCLFVIRHIARYTAVSEP